MLDKSPEEAFNTWEAPQSLQAFKVLFLKAGRRKIWPHVRKGATSLGPMALQETFSWLQPFCLCSEPWVKPQSQQRGSCSWVQHWVQPWVRWQLLLQGVAALKQLLLEM